MRLETHELGVFFAERYRLSVYDAMMAASALRACDILLSEAMQNGAVLEGRLRIVNPFENGEA